MYCKDNHGVTCKMISPFQNTIPIKTVKAYGIYVLCHVLVFMLTLFERLRQEG